MPTMDQVAWAQVNISTGGETASYKRGDLLPETADPEEAAQRSLLRIGGAIRIVEVVYTAEELAEQARSRGEATAAAMVAHDVDLSVPLAEQTQVGGEPGPPTLTSAHGGPVVIGDEDLRREHDKQAKAAEQRRREPPPANAAKAAWVAHAVDVHGADPAEAEKMSRDDLADKYGAKAGAKQAEGKPSGGPAPDRASAEAQPPGDQSGQRAPRPGQPRQPPGGRP